LKIKADLGYAKKCFIYSKVHIFLKEVKKHLMFHNRRKIMYIYVGVEYRMMLNLVYLS
jgi:hypothetical protein